MVNEGIVMGHKISERGIEVDKAKLDAIEKMPCPKDIKGIVVSSVMLVSIGGLLKTSLKFLGLLQIFYKRIFLLFLVMIVWKPSKPSTKP